MEDKIPLKRKLFIRIFGGECFDALIAQCIKCGNNCEDLEKIKSRATIKVLEKEKKGLWRKLSKLNPCDHDEEKCESCKLNNSYNEALKDVLDYISDLISKEKTR